MDGGSVKEAQATDGGGNRPFVVALTGGPCAGKTTLLSRLRECGAIGGCKLLFVPEAATILVGRGFVIGQDVRDFQTRVMLLQRELEDAAIVEARASGEPSVIVCDRGMLDGAGYCPPEMFAQIMDDVGVDTQELADRYDLALHLVSAAVEAPEAYTTGNNEARIETLDEAVAQEQRTVEAWAAHPRRMVVSTTGGFEAKMNAAMAAMIGALTRSLPEAMCQRAE